MTRKRRLHDSIERAFDAVAENLHENKAARDFALALKDLYLELLDEL